jgi:hypothetical protein
MRKLVIVFKEDGTTEVDADGFIGSECVEFTEKILKGVNPKLHQRNYKGEYYVKQKQKTHVTV